MHMPTKREVERQRPYIFIYKDHVHVCIYMYTHTVLENMSTEGSETFLAMLFPLAIMYTVAIIMVYIHVHVHCYK